MRQILSTIILMVACTLAAEATVKVTNLQTCYQTEPMGIENTPMLSWQITNDDPSVYGTSQTAYQIVAATSITDLNAGRYVYDTGKTIGTLSVGIPLNLTLQPQTRYYWRVRVWNEKNKATDFSDASWFETGLGSIGWSNAQWIGSKYNSLSRYRSSLFIDYDVEFANGDATFLFGAKDQSTNVRLTLRHTADSTTMILSHLCNSAIVEDATEDVTSALTSGDKHHVTIEVFSAQYLRKYNLNIAIDGQTIKNSHPNHADQSAIPEFLRAREGEFIVSPHPENPLYTDCRLYGIGYAQTTSGITFSNIRLSDNVRHQTLYADSATHTTVQGDSVVWLPSRQAAAPMLRKTFTLRGEVASARLYATARGIYDMSINGQMVTSDFYNPGWTDYRYRLMYNTYDVTSLLHAGPNAIGAVLGTGWYSDYVGFNCDWQDQYGQRQSLLAKLVVTYEDGSKDIIVSDSSWQQYNQGPVIENSLQNGEEYDARREPCGWDTPNFSADGWEQATIVDAPESNVVLQAYIGGTIQEKETRQAIRIEEPRPHVYVYDMGVNMVGVPRLKLKGREGQTVTIRYGEMIWPHEIPSKPVAPYTIEQYQQNQGLVCTDNYRSAMSTDRYTLRGDAMGETFSPRLTQHGFRYIQIEGLDSPLALNDVEGLVLHSMNSQQLSSYETSDSLTNQLFRNIVWGQKGNFLAVPTDCPQRDERLGWMGDGQIFSQSSTYNFNVAPFFHRWMLTVRDNQDKKGNFSNFCPNVGSLPQHDNGGGEMGWTEAGIIIPWNIYVQYGDKEILRENYSAMQRYMNYLHDKAADDVMPACSFGDWLAFEPTETQLINNGWYAYDALLMTKIAQTLGRESDAKYYGDLYNRIKAKFQSLFFTADGTTRIPAGGQVGVFVPQKIDKDSLQDTETSYIMPLYIGLTPNREQATQHLLQALERNNHLLSTGFVGTPWLCKVLSANGQTAEAYRLFQERRFPSWLYPVTQGATTIWERWNSYTLEQGFGPVDMNSFNHYSYGAIEEWMMEYSLGIKADSEQAGYKHFTLQPQVGGTFSYIRGSLRTVYGLIESSWQRQADGTVVYKFTVPANTTATLSLPGTLTFLQGQRGATLQDGCYLLQSGHYVIVSEL